MSLAADSDAELARRSTAGDQRAFGMLAQRHGPRLARTVRAMGVAPGDVEDVVQTALVAAWRALADYDPQRPFLGWASRIAINKARDWLRHARVRRAWTGGPPLDRPDVLAVHEPTAGLEAMEARARVRRIAAAVDALPDHLKAPMVLISVTGLTQREAAQALGISARAAEHRIAEARRLLEIALRAPERDPGQ